MFDTNIFNAILDGNVDLELLKGKGDYFVTHVQLDEINETKDKDRRKSLNDTFHAINQASIPTESGVFDRSKWGCFKWSKSDNLYHKIKDKLDKTNKNKKNNDRDALIAETAIFNHITLVTHDKDLFSATTDFGGACVNMCAVITCKKA